MIDVGIAGDFEHEELSVFHDAVTGVTGVIAVHSTALGPAMGGLRLHRYPTLDDAIRDALRLGRAMSFKNAAAGLDLGGGKAVIIDDGGWTVEREARMRALGRAVEALRGRYITAEDVGTTPADMDAIAAVTDHVAGRSRAHGGSGDPSPYTARTVFGAIESGVRVRLGCPDLAGIRVGVEGVGHVGRQLVGLLTAAGAIVSVTDLDRDRAVSAAADHGAIALPTAGFIEREIDVFAPCALGSVIDADAAAKVSAVVVAGAANNPLAVSDVATLLAERNVLYVPDFLANCGGIISVGGEALELSHSRREQLLGAALDRTESILREAHRSGRLPLEIAEEWALDRMRGPRQVAPAPAAG